MPRMRCHKFTDTLVGRSSCPDEGPASASGFNVIFPAAFFEVSAFSLGAEPEEADEYLMRMTGGGSLGTSSVSIIVRRRAF